jgi:carbonic anhydrase
MDRLCELNVAEQFANICKTTILQDAWKRGQRIVVHGLVYSLHDGLLRELGLSAVNRGSAELGYASLIQQRGAIVTPSVGKDAFVNEVL